MKDTFKIYIAEDDIWYGELLQYHLSLNPEYEVKRFETGKALLDAMNDRPNVVTLDYMLPDYNGDKLLQRLRSSYPDTEVVVISGQEDVGTAVGLLREGAYDYVVKDAEAKDRLWSVVAKIRENMNLKQELADLKEEVGQKYDVKSAILGNSRGIQKVYGLIEKAAQSDITVSVTGETGTGKELVAKAIHYNSKRNKKPFVAINVSAIPNDLIESELFGHEKGAFTGASARRIGKFEEANNGTLFLDEIGEMELNMQSKLLRVLQEQELVRVGGNKRVKINCRIVVATHRNLIDEVKNGNFRQDLYYRLLGLPVELPPLRDRQEDIPVLANHFVAAFAKTNKLGHKRLAPDALKELANYQFPGNIRELKALVELSAVLADGDLIEKDNLNFQTADPFDHLLQSERTLKEYTHAIILHFLKKYDNNVLKVAAKLDIGKSTIYRMLKEDNE